MLNLRCTGLLSHDLTGLQVIVQHNTEQLAALDKAACFGPMTVREALCGLALAAENGLRSEKALIDVHIE